MEENQNPRVSNTSVPPNAGKPLNVTNIVPSTSPVVPTAVPTSRFKALLATVGPFYAQNKYYVWAAVLGIIVLVVLAFIAFRPQEPILAPAKVDISIDAPTVSPSGGEAVLKVKITNKDTATLNKAELELVYPEGASYVDSTPKAIGLTGTTFPVPDLQPGQNVAVLIKVRIQGQINDEKKLIAKLHYRYTNFSSDFVAETTHTVRLVAADVALEISGPQTTNNAQVVTYEIGYKNNSDKEIQNGRIELTYPDHFQFASAEPQPNLGKNIWNVGTLQKGQQGKISFQGSFASGGPGQSETFKAAFLVLDASGSFFTQADTTFTTQIGSLPLVVTQEVISGSSNGITKPGETLRYKLSYRNNAAVAAKGAIIVLTIDSQAVDLGSIQAEGAQVNNGTITWNASSNSNLETLNPNESGNLEFSLKIKNPPVRDTSRNLEVKTAVKIKSDEYETFLPGGDLAIKISTQASVDTSLEHISGQLPPQVGKESTYRLNIALSNSTNELRDGVLTAFIPVAASGVDLSSIQPAREVSNVTFDSSTGKLTWKVGILSAHVGDFSPLRKMSINVRIVPSSNQVGREVELLKTVGMKIVDSFTGENLSLSGNALTTSNLKDSNGYTVDGSVRP